MSLLRSKSIILGKMSHREPQSVTTRGWLNPEAVDKMLIPYACALSRLVIETLDPLPKDRKCFRMVNGVLVERTIEDVLPALKTNSDGLKQVLEELLKQYKLKQNELDSWKVCLLLLSPQELDDMVISQNRIVLTIIDYRKRTTSRLCSHKPNDSLSQCHIFDLKICHIYCYID